MQQLHRAQRALNRRKPRSKVRFSFDHGAGNRNSATRIGSARRSSRQLNLAETPVPSASAKRSILKKQPGRSPSLRSNQQDRYCFQDGNCLTTSPKRRHPSLKPHLDVGLRPYWGELPRSPIQSSPKSSKRRQETHSSLKDQQPRHGVDETARTGQTAPSSVVRIPHNRLASPALTPLKYARTNEGATKTDADMASLGKDVSIDTVLYLPSPNIPPCPSDDEDTLKEKKDVGTKSPMVKVPSHTRTEFLQRYNATAEPTHFPAMKRRIVRLRATALLANKPLPPPPKMEEVEGKSLTPLQLYHLFNI